MIAMRHFGIFLPVDNIKLQEFVIFPKYLKVHQYWSPFSFSLHGLQPLNPLPQYGTAFNLSVFLCVFFYLVLSFNLSFVLFVFDFVILLIQTRLIASIQH